MVLDFLIQAACQSVDMEYTTSCYKAMEASAKQAQVWDYTDQAEKNVIKNARQSVGEGIYKTTVVGASAYRIFRTKEAVYRIKENSFSDQVLLRVSPNSGKVDFTWILP